MVKKNFFVRCYPTKSVLPGSTVLNRLTLTAFEFAKSFGELLFLVERHLGIEEVSFESWQTCANLTLFKVVLCNSGQFDTCRRSDVKIHEKIVPRYTRGF